MGIYCTSTSAYRVFLLPRYNFTDSKGPLDVVRHYIYTYIHLVYRRGEIKNNGTAARSRDHRSGR